MSTIITALQKRYATKKFDPLRTVSPEDISEIQHALQLTASSFGLQAYRISVIRNSDLQRKLMEVSWQQTQIRDASHIILFMALDTVTDQYIERFADLHRSIRRTPEDKLQRFMSYLRGFINRMDASQTLEWSARQTYIAMGNLLSILVLKGIDSCPIEGIEKSEWDRMLGLPALGLHSVACVAIGYRAEDDSSQYDAKVRFPIDELFIELPVRS